VVEHFRPFFQTVRLPIDSTLNWVQGLLTGLPTLAMIALIGLLAWQFAGRALAIGTTVALLLVAMLGIWPEAMVTLSLVLTSLVFCMVIGLPLGVLLASSDRAQRIMRPVLDAMQTTPAFVYLVPVVMLFGIGNVPGVIVTIIFALAPLVRLTNLGLRQVRPDLIEAARAYGASPWQMLVKVQLPLAMPSIMAGINQALMLSLSMVVIASMIAVGGLGQMVLRGIGRLDMGLATVGGLGIVLLAITLDRLTQAMGKSRRSAGRRWWHTGPAGFVRCASCSGWWARRRARVRTRPFPPCPRKRNEQSRRNPTHEEDQRVHRTQPRGHRLRRLRRGRAWPANDLPGKGVTVLPLKSSLAEEAFQTLLVMRALEKLGYTVEPMKDLEPATEHLAIANGDATFMANHWSLLHADFYKNSGGDAKLWRTGVYSDGAVQGYLIDRKTAEQYNITNIAQLKDPAIAKLFDADGDGKADLTGCNPGWGCELAIENHLTAYQLRDTVTHKQGSYAALMADTIARFKQDKPVLYYTWTPYWVSAVLRPGTDVVWLQVPFSSSQEGAANTQLPNGKNYGFQANRSRSSPTRRSSRRTRRRPSCSR
jgi:ABC-type proline/glycine betaine transport system permease subunit/ABC-type proline/glycine betaine transport system substrate-binding protein